MKKFIPVLFLFLITFISYSQIHSFDLYKGPELKVKKSYFDKIIYADENSFYTFGGKRRHAQIYSSKPDYYIKKYSVKTLEAQEEWLLDDHYSKRKLRFNSVLYGKRQTHLFFASYDKGIDHLVRISVERGSEISPFETVFSVPSKFSGYRPYNLRISRDSTKILVFSDRDPENGRETSKVKVFNEDFEIIWSGELRVPNVPQDYYYNDVKVDNEGNIWILGYLAEENSVEEYRKKSSSLFNKDLSPSVTRNYILFRLSSDGSVGEYHLYIHGKYIHQANIQPDINGGIVVTGFYSDAYQDHANSFFYLRLEQESLTLISKTFERLDGKFLDHFDFSTTSALSRIGKGYLTGNYSEGLKGLKAYHFDRFIEKPDGSMALVAEKSFYHVAGTAYPLPDAAYSGKETHGIIIVNISEDEVDWYRYIPKKQIWGIVADRYSPFLSYHLHREGSTLHFLYNDHKDNIENLRNGKEIRPLGGTSSLLNMEFAVVQATVSPSGEIDYEHVLLRSENKEMLVPDKCFQVSPDKSILDLTKFLKKRYISSFSLK